MCDPASKHSGSIKIVDFVPVTPRLNLGEEGGGHCCAWNTVSISDIFWEYLYIGWAVKPGTATLICAWLFGISKKLNTCIVKEDLHVTSSRVYIILEIQMFLVLIVQGKLICI